VKFERALTPVVVKGRFLPDPQARPGFIYPPGRDFGGRPVLDETPDLGPREAAKTSASLS